MTDEKVVEKRSSFEGVVLEATALRLVQSLAQGDEIVVRFVGEQQGLDCYAIRVYSSRPLESILLNKAALTPRRPQNQSAMIEVVKQIRARSNEFDDIFQGFGLLVPDTESEAERASHDDEKAEHQEEGDTQA